MSAHNDQPPTDAQDVSHHESNWKTYTDPFGNTREMRPMAPSRDYPLGVEPEFRCYPMQSSVPNIDIDHPGIGHSLAHYIGREMLEPTYIEYRRDDASVWLDAANPGSPAPRRTPQLSEGQTQRLTDGQQDLAGVPYAEPLEFIACEATDKFWECAVAAGWVPSERALALMVQARNLLDTPFVDDLDHQQHHAEQLADDEGKGTDFYGTPPSHHQINAAEQEFYERVSYQRAINRVHAEAKPGRPSPEQAAELDQYQASLEQRYGDAGPYTDFEWGMVNGKLSALRWVLGSEWDFLDT